MPAWNVLLNNFEAVQPNERAEWVGKCLTQALKRVSELRGGANVILYSSAFLQKSNAPFECTSMVHEDLNGFMTVVGGMDWDRPLVLILHTPGGNPASAESLVEYLRAKFPRLEVIVPTLAMSAGTMVSLASDLIVMGHQSQLGPIDPQMMFPKGAVSARAIVEQFKKAKEEILEDHRAAHAWHPILQSLGPAHYIQAQHALDYGENMVAKWLARYMFSEREGPEAAGRSVAKHFNDATHHKSHSRRIGRDECRDLGLEVEDLEDSQDLQDQALTAYHVATLMFLRGPTTKIIATDRGKQWVKTWGK